MITLTVTRDNLTVPGLPLTLADNGTGTYVVEGFKPGDADPQLVTAGSRWTPGAAYVSHVDSLVTMELAVRVRASSYVGLRAAVDDLVAAFRQYRYTVTEADSLTGSVIATYACLPAKADTGADPIQVQQFTTVVSLLVPRQP